MHDFWTMLLHVGASGATLAGLLWAFRAACGSLAAHRERIEALRVARDVECARASHPLPITNYAPHITYSPHARYQSASVPELTTAAAVDDHAAPDTVPGMIDLAAIDHTPTVQSILLGFGTGSQPITVSAKNLMHTGLIGATGGGKSNTGRLLLAQLLACGVPCVLADPHYTDYDPESGDDWRPIAQRLRMAPARKAGDIGDLFQWLIEEMTRRYDRREAGEKVGAAIVAYVDELPAIVADVPGAMDTLGKLLREGRKVGLYLLTSSQDLLASTLKTGGEIRENLRTCYYSGGAGHSAVQLLDMPKRDISTYEAQLGQGVVLLRSSATSPARLARVPLASNQGIARLLPDTLHGSAETLDTEPIRQASGNTPAKGYTAQERRILDMFASGASVAEIAREISGAKNGRRYTEASEQAQETLRAHLQARAVGGE